MTQAGTVRTYRSALITTGIALLFACADALAANSVNFPGKVSELKSPDGKCTIKNVDDFESASRILSADPPANHHLFLIRKGEKRKLLLWSYYDNVDILWSPDSGSFILNDWDRAKPYLYRTGDPRHPLDIAAKLTAAVKDKTDRQALNSSEHLYIFAARWLSAKSIQIKVSGCGAPDGDFTLTYTWDLKDGFTRVKREAKMDVTRDVKPSH
jgi:hypothetical protein